MTYYIRNGSMFRITDEANVDIHKHLPADNYIIKEDPYGNLYLDRVGKFTALQKYYGDTLKNTDRILNTFSQRPHSTGVMLTGEKGSGKTLLAKNISIEANKLNIPTIVINNAWTGDKFNQLIQSIDQECIVLFDEFEKVYNERDQESVLTLLDGVYPSKKLFIITCNDKWRIDRHMRNRPGRIFYMLDFKGLSAEFITQYCGENLNDKEHIDQICKIASLFEEFNFDMLKAIVEDMNRYNETPQEALRMLNAKPEYDNNPSRSSHYDVEITLSSGKVIDRDMMDEPTLHSNPISMTSINFDYSVSDDESETVTFYQKDLKHIDGVNGVFGYINEDGDRLKLVRRKVQPFNYFAL